MKCLTPIIPRIMTYAQQFEEAMKCETIQEADAWLAQEIARYRTDYKKGPTEAARLIRQNIAYHAQILGGQDKADRLYLCRGPQQLAFGAMGSS